MDQPTPLVKAEVNKGEERERKGGGLWADFASKLGGNFSGGVGAGGVAGGGLLATKAGLVGLILVGTTVAGGLGMVGYKVFGGGAGAEGEGAYSIFEAKPPQAEGSEGSGSASGKGGDGTSDSLNMFAKANLTEEPKAEEAPVEATPAEPTVNAVAGSATAPINHGSASSPAASPKLAGGPRIGGMSGGGGGGGGSSASSSLGSGAAGLNAGGGRGSLSAMGRSDGRAGGGGRGIANARRRGSGMRQLGAIMKDNRGARSSAAAGRTYDGGQTSGSAIGPEGGTPQGGTGQGGRGASGSMGQPTPSSGPQETEPPPTPPPAKNVTPYQKALEKAQMYLMIGMALLFLADKIGKTGWGKGIAQIMKLAAAGFGAMAMKIGFDIAFGEFAQPLQGAAMILGGGFLVAAVVAEAAGVTGADLELLMTLAKFVPMAALAVGFLSPPKEIKPGDKDYDRAKHFEETGKFGSLLPSEKGLERFLIG